MSYDVLHTVFPSAVKVVLVYPFLYSMLNTILCAPYGTMHALKLQCKCPTHRSGPYCKTCLIDPQKGTCLTATYRCKDKWMGHLCTVCPATDPPGTTCKASCDNSRGYYGSAETTKCRYCISAEQCSGHGTCKLDGTCECDDGWAALALEGSIGSNRDCDTQCGGPPGAAFCSGHGKCSAGARCDCDAPYCGRYCTENMSATEDNIYCNNMGFAIVPTTQLQGEICTCTCFRKDGEPVAFGNKCELACPVGTGGDICGTTGTPLLRDNICQCSCNSEEKTGITPVACDSSCKYGAISQLDGTCQCLFQNQNPLFNCGRCKSHYAFPELGCQEYCHPDRTCVIGTCKKDSQERVMKCDCGAQSNRDPTISVLSDVTAFTYEQSLEYDFQFTVNRDNIDPASDERTITFKPAIEADPASTHSLAGQVWAMKSGDTARVSISPSLHVIEVSMSKTYTLAEPIALLLEDDYYVVSVISYEPVQTLEQTCISMKGCVAFSPVHNELYRCIAKFGVGTGCGPYATNANTSVYEVATQVTLPYTAMIYSITVQDSKRRGCATCLDSWYPEPIDTTECNVEKGCVHECLRTHTCNNKGNCTKCGKCVCDAPNADPDYGCGECLPNYFPHPDTVVDGLSDCSRLCVSGARDSIESRGGWYCSGHGACANDGRCDVNCAAVAGGEPSGWTGAHCELACNQTADVVCSGHGTCIEGVCTCNQNYYGKLCDVTCSRPDQYFYVEENEDCDDQSCVPVCDDSVGECGPCEDGSTCMKKQCNGGECETHFQYTHENSTFYYEPCYNLLEEDTLRNCTGWRDEPLERWRARNLTAKDIRSQYGIYCDTGARTDFRGICKQAQCKCSELDTVTKITNSEGIPTTSRVALSRGGEGCQVVGCRAAQFSNAGDFTSFCGQHVPPTIRNPIGYYDNGLVQGMIDLEKEKSRVQQHCSHGACLPGAKQPGLTKSNPAPAGVQGVQGACQCKGTPKAEPENVCQSDTSPDWASRCCTTTIGGDNPYFGSACMDECVCDRKLWWKGSCAGDVPGVMSLGCNCRQGFHGYSSSVVGERAALFCGMTCKSQCKGIVHRNTKTGVQELFDHGTKQLRDFCPNAVPSSESPYAGCYDGFLPCSGHGACARATGSCVHADVVDHGKCQCWGSAVFITGVNLNARLPDLVSLYGGEDCNAKCPGTDTEFDYDGGKTTLAQWFDANYHLLHAPQTHMSAEQRTSKELYFTLYQATVCSGHGWCTPDSTIEGDHMQCECLTGWGGTQCDEQCTLDPHSWGDRLPMQHRVEVTGSGTSPLSAQLSTFYGMSPCGPNSDCLNNRCVPGDDKGTYAKQTYADALKVVARLTQRTTTDPDLVNFFEQWSLAFVGKYAACGPLHYSTKQLTTQSNIYSYDIPLLVRWQLARSCDALYTQNTWMQDNGPWCCTYPTIGLAWHDDTQANYAGFTHGGCPDGYCSNFASGRQCDKCVSEAFVDYTTDTLQICPATANTRTGKCAICAGGADAHLISPYESATDMRVKKGYYQVDNVESCERCISYARELSGDQVYALASTESRVCNGRGKCMGKPNTYSGIASRPNDVSDAPAGTSLLCESNVPSAHHYQLGLCDCDAGWEGPTCAMPTTDASCGEDGSLVSIGRLSLYKEPHDSPYSYCKCKSRTGHYCKGNDVDNIFKFAVNDLMPCQTVQNVLTGPTQGAQIVECNDPTGASPCDASGLCQTCAHPELDPASLCIEYKATGVDGIVQQHRNKVKQRAGC